MKFLRLISIAALTSHTFSFDEQRVLQDDNTKTAHVTVATKKLEEFIEKTLKEWKMPGMSVAIVEGNETWLRGFGWDRKSDMRPVSPYQTLFYVGSLTKSFTAAAMAQIVENNVDFPDVQWDTPISSLLRDDFVLSDLCATEHITIEDALSHRTGYPAHDFVSWDSPRAATRGLRDLPMSAQPRSRFQYSNQMVTTVGYLIEKLYERANPYHFPTTLEQVMISKLWGPMNMFRTHFDFYSGVPSTAADELWYHNDSGSYVVVPHDTHRGHLGAGMAISCAQDFARYMSRMMDPNWGPISARAKAAIKAPHMVIAPSHPQYTGPYYYGLGWTGAVFEGEEVWFHDGQMREHRTEMWMAPGRNFSVVIMANANTPAVKIVLWKIIYDFFGVDEGRRFEVEKSQRDAIRARELRLETCRERLYPPSEQPTLPRPLPLEAYTGTYRNPGYGNFSVALTCHGPRYAANSPAHPTTNETGCYLTGSGKLEYEGKAFHVDLEHVRGGFWLAWLFVDAYAPPTEDLTVRPTECLRAQFTIGPDGEVNTFAADFRDEGDDAPLVWYDRILLG